MKNVLQEFKDFINQGNLVEMAVGIIIGLKVKDLVDALVNGIIMPIVGAIFGKATFNDLTLKIGDGVILYGTFITAAVNFILVALVVFFLVKAYNAMKRPKAEEAAGPDEIELLTQIRDSLQNR